MTGSQITTHVLDAAQGRPAAGIAVELLRHDGGDGWTSLAHATTDDDGRVNALGPERVAPGEYRLRFDTGAYFAARGTAGFYPEVLITFVVDEEGRHHHVPILLSPFAYSTYRGS
ncbi:hydroxyisourate hydrolase [Agromyces sp. NPDC058126]|uniref:hydroxyisourate hydrolase n=1 Tax=Agromyces sp. NPDC058126 TaxID=3346350 RepID=UPI0036DC8164